jgi:acyl carrier protein
MTSPITIEAVEAVVRPHLKLLAPGVDLAPTQPLGEAGLDSMASIDLLLDLEGSFGISIDDEALTENSFENLGEILKLVEASAA